MAPPPPPPPPPNATPIQPRGYVQIGAHEFGPGAPTPSARCVVTLKPKGKGKVDKKNAQGKDDAKTTWQGKEPADLEIDIEWNARDEEADADIEDRLADISPRGPNAGQSQTIAARRLRVHAIDTVIIEEMDGPDDVPGTSKVTCKLKCASISKNAQAGQAGQGDAKTPTDPTKADGTTAPSPGQQWKQAPTGNGAPTKQQVITPVPTVTP